MLADGREINLGLISASLDDAAGRRALHDLVVGRAVTLAAPGETAAKTADRYGRLRGTAAVRIGDELVWLQGALVSGGHARVSLDAAGACGHKELLRLENEARRRGVGHWATGVFTVLDATNASEVAALTGHFAIVEGRLRRRSKSRKGIYFNFGTNWRDDVTIFVPGRLLKQQRGTAEQSKGPKNQQRQGAKAPSIAAAFDLKSRLPAGTRIRARGWIEERAGPMIEVQNLDQIEWAD